MTKKTVRKEGSVSVFLVVEVKRELEIWQMRTKSTVWWTEG